MDEIEKLAEEIFNRWSPLAEPRDEWPASKFQDMPKYIGARKDCEEIARFILTREKSLRDRLEALRQYAVHERTCILSFWEAGEPTLEGGYRCKYKGKWYQSDPVDELPKCDCGLEEVIIPPIPETSREGERNGL